jgi:hypothetical protein
MPCARWSHALADMHAPAVVPPPLCPAAFEPQVAPTPAGRHGRRRWDGDKSRCTCWLDANGWRRPCGAGELPPTPPFPFPLLVSLPRSLTPSSPRRISLVCTIRQDRSGNSELILHDEVEWLEQTVRYYVGVMAREQRSEPGITPERARHILKKGKVRRVLPASCCFITDTKP